MASALQGGANVNARDEAGKTHVLNKTAPALIVAVREGHVNVTRMLLARGADVSLGKFDGSTALHIACQEGNANSAKIARMLLDKGAAVDALNHKKVTPLMAASQHGHENIVRLLLEKGADVHRVNWKGDTALSLAKEHGHVRVAALLQEKGAKF